VAEVAHYCSMSSTGGLDVCRMGPEPLTSSIGLAAAGLSSCSSDVVVSSTEIAGKSGLLPWCSGWYTSVWLLLRGFQAPVAEAVAEVGEVFIASMSFSISALTG